MSVEVEQISLVGKFRNALGPVGEEYGDEDLSRWLRARNNDVNKAKIMLLKNIEWRKDYRVDSLLKWEPPEVLTKYYPGGLFGRDKEGCPIYIENLGYADVKGIMYSVQKTDIIKFKIQNCEIIRLLLEERRNELGHGKVGLVIIFDLSLYSMGHLWTPALNVYGEVLKIFEAHYPETLKCTYVVNAPKIFPMAYNLFKSLLSEDTRRKVKVLSSNWKEELLVDIDKDNLPEFWGGSAKQPDIHCRVCMGGKIPQSYYKNASQGLQNSVRVSRSNFAEVEKKVESVGSRLSWIFSTEANDIGFSVFLKSLGGADDPVCIVPYVRVNCHLVPEQGSIEITKIGTYIFKFDNSYSRFHQKTISYSIEVAPLDKTFKTFANNLSD